MKTIGLIGGMSWQSSAEYYRLINEGVNARLGGHNNAKSLMVTVNFHDIETQQHQGRWDELGRQMALSARQLQAGGADFIVLCTNTMHLVAEEIERATDLPLLHIADATAQAVRRAGIQRVGLLGTRFTMETEFYRGCLQSRHGIEVIVPSAQDRETVHRIIYEELCHGTVRDVSREEYRRVMQTLQASGADAIVLGCTEIGLLVKAGDSPAPLFDSTRIHAQQAVETALDDGV
jgi:aspartate racemase